MSLLLYIYCICLADPVCVSNPDGLINSDLYGVINTECVSNPDGIGTMLRA